jgi:hypothetical protein
MRMKAHSNHNYSTTPVECTKGMCKGQYRKVLTPIVPAVASTQRQIGVDPIEFARVNARLMVMPGVRRAVVRCSCSRVLNGCARIGTIRKQGI